MLVLLKMICSMEKEYIFGVIIGDMRVNGNKINKTAMEFILGQIKIFMKANFRME